MVRRNVRRYFENAEFGTNGDLPDLPAKSIQKMKISGAQIKAARDLLKLSPPELADASGVSERTLRKFETDEAIPKPATIDKIVNELERRGIEFTNGSGIGVRLIFEKAAEFARTMAPVSNVSDE